MTIDPGLIDRARSSFIAHFDAKPDFLVHAPGRVNLIGEHTDYNDGFVLPMAISYGTVIAIGVRDDDRIEAVASDFDGAKDSFALGDTIMRREDAAWTHHVRGIVDILQKRGNSLTGANLAISGNVPQGAGLSSSASLGVAMAMGLSHAKGLEHYEPTDFAKIAQQSENEFVGTACGIMDQMVSACAQDHSAVLIDCRSLECRPVPVPSNSAIMIIHSGVARELADSAYNERRAQCEAVARHFGVTALRDISMEALLARQAELDPIAFRRARHVISANRRVMDAEKAFHQGDLPWLGELMAQSHISMRDDFEITVPKVDELVVTAQQAIGDFGGARMTGGGFGGCIVAIMPEIMAGKVRQTILEEYRDPQGQPPRIFDAVPSAGATIL